MKENPIVSINRELLQAIFEGAKNLYPRETFLLRRGKKEKTRLAISELVVPPLATYGRGFANAPLHMLPVDFSIIGTIHSHPSGNLKPSAADLNHSFGRIIMIAGFPFTDEQNIAGYDRNGEKLALQIVEE